jgi:preprotein translocase subunit SecD
VREHAPQALAIGTVLRNKGRNMRSAAASFTFGLFLSAPVFAEPRTLEVTEAEVAYDARNSAPIVTVRLSETSRKAFADFSARHVGEKIDLRIDGNSVMKTVIREPITGGVGQILATSKDGAQQLTERLKSKAPLVVEAIP